MSVLGTFVDRTAEALAGFFQVCTLHNKFAGKVCFSCFCRVLKIANRTRLTLEDEDSEYSVQGTRKVTVTRTDYSFRSIEATDGIVSAHFNFEFNRVEY